MDICFWYYLQGGTVAVKTCMDKPDAFRGMVVLGAAILENPEKATPFKVRDRVVQYQLVID